MNLDMKFPSRMGSLFIKVSHQDSSDTPFPATVTWMNVNTTKFEGYFREMTNTNEPNNLNNTFEDINATETMKYYSFPKEGEGISEAIKTEGVQIVSVGSYQKEKDPTVAS